MVRHVLTLDDLSSDEIREVLSLSADLKSKFNAGIREDLFPRRVMAMLFQKPSLRTRVSFETGIRHLGGASLFLGEDVGWGNRESIEDFVFERDDVRIEADKYATYARKMHAMMNGDENFKLN